MVRVSAVCHGGPELASGFQTPPCDDSWSTRVMHAIGFCHLLLQSRAPVPRSLPTRSRLAPTDSLRIPRSPHALEELPPVGRTIEHPVFSRHRGGYGGLSAWRFLSPGRRSVFLPLRPSSIDPVTRLSRRADAPACESLRSGPHTLTTPRSLRSETREGLTSARSGAPSIERSISSTSALRHPPRATRDLVPHRTGLLDSGGFAATRPRSAPLHRDDAVLLCANTVVSARPPFTSADLFDADASLSQTQPFDFCNEFSTTTHEHTTASAALARRRGMPYDRCHARLRFSRCLRHPLGLQRWLELDAPQRAARIPRHPGSRPGPRRPVSLHPRERHLSSGPAGHGKHAGRKSGAKVNRTSLAGRADPGRLAPRGPSSIALSNPSCHWRCVRDGMEARSRACTRPHHPPRPSFRSCSREGSRLSENRGAFHRGNRMTEGIAPWDIRQVLPATRPMKALQREAATPLLPKVHARG